MPVKPGTHKPTWSKTSPRERSGQYSQLYTLPKWRKLRSRFLNANPLCAICQESGRVTAATIVDHIVPHKGDMEKFWNGPFQALCKPCHDSHKKRMEHGGMMRRIGVDGYPMG